MVLSAERWYCAEQPAGATAIAKNATVTCLSTLRGRIVAMGWGFARVSYYFAWFPAL